MKIKELIERLQTEINKVDISKIHSHKEFHALMKKTISPLLPPKLFLCAWIINDTNNDRPIIVIERDFVRYKNCSRFIDKGKFSNIKLKAVINENLDLSDVKKYYTDLENKEREKNLLDYINQLEKDLSGAKEQLTKLRLSMQLTPKAR